MKKIFTVAFAVLMIFAVQLQCVEAAKTESQPTATPIEEAKVYPKDLVKDLNYRGTVVVSATVSAEGKVIATKIMRSSGRPKIDKIAMDAAAKWEFKPAVDKKGKAMEVWYMIRFESKDF